ncbi:MAG: metallopeptidase family protein [Chloroflexota bacterium]
MHITPTRFEQLAFNAADEVLAQLPPDLRANAERVILDVADKPAPEMLEKTESGGALLGLYQGVPLIHRHSNSIILQPDRITLFRLALASLCRTEVELKAQLRKTIIHELGHYFGFSEEELEERGWA